MHGYGYGFEFAEPVQHCNRFHGVTGIPVPNIWSGEWSHDLVDPLTTPLNYTIQTTTTVSTPNHRRERLLAGWKRGARTVSKQPQRPQHGPNDVNHRLGLL
jgi:hypothetical protein